MAEIPWGLIKGIGAIAVVLFFALLGKLLLTKIATASASATAATAAAATAATAATAETAAGTTTTTTTTTPSSRTGFEDGPNSPSYQRPDPVSVTTPESCISDHPGTYFQNGQCVGCRRVANMHESIDSSSLSCSGPRGSTILATPITLDNSDYGDFPISGGPETIDLFCKLSNYYNTKEDGTGECLPFEGGPCNDEYCAENGVNGGSLGGITSREDCVSPNVWVGEYHQNRGVDSAGSCNICDLTENTIDYEGGSRSSFFNSLECNACEPGASGQYVSNDGECEICPIDHRYSPGPPATCTECTGGRKYINATTNTCENCPDNSYHHRVGDNPAECHPKAGSLETCWVEEGVQGPGFVSSQCTSSKSCSKGNEQVLKCRTTNEHSCSAACSNDYWSDACKTSEATANCSSGYCGYNGNCTNP